MFCSFDLFISILRWFSFFKFLLSSTCSWILKLNVYYNSAPSLTPKFVLIFSIYSKNGLCLSFFSASVPFCKRLLSSNSCYGYKLSLLLIEASVLKVFYLFVPPLILLNLTFFRYSLFPTHHYLLDHCHYELHHFQILSHAKACHSL